ncbi:hypothetical protein BS50DRAFT_235366 [Corynespora cassiicola Philippines]|uniref:Uncharacterized protein n=1 Tax=Corynespora cassiicola Philippines TaxID=1448308 RepID=A0A2T2P348_CORCC|nr:hypothetical protein BS50DRAFT_235366 [Corynespora cassiicola Philippines]
MNRKYGVHVPLPVPSSLPFLARSSRAIGRLPICEIRTRCGERGSGAGQRASGQASKCRRVIFARVRWVGGWLMNGRWVLWWWRWCSVVCGFVPLSGDPLLGCAGTGTGTGKVPSLQLGR